MQNGGEKDTRDGTEERGTDIESTQVESHLNETTKQKENNNKYIGEVRN